jgi:hypothetical protein
MEFLCFVLFLVKMKQRFGLDVPRWWENEFCVLCLVRSQSGIIWAHFCTASRVWRSCDCSLGGGSCIVTLQRPSLCKKRQSPISQ